jgi:hypothetical protein
LQNQNIIIVRISKFGHQIIKNAMRIYFVSISL